MEDRVIGYSSESAPMPSHTYSVYPTSTTLPRASPMAQRVKKPSAMQETQDVRARFLG